MDGRIRAALTSGLAVGLLLLGSQASAAPPERGSDAPALATPDVTYELVVLINTTRDAYCTPEQVAFEEAIVAWIESGEVGPFPEGPEQPGLEPVVHWQDVTTGKGALVSRAWASDVHIELWVMDPEGQRPLVGPCTDTDDTSTLFATGTLDYRATDNDVFGSGTRGNTFSERFRAEVVTPDGEAYVYTWHVRVNDRCAWPEGEAPRCLIERSTLRAR